MPSKTVALIIPARFGSVRFAGKQLAEIEGADGQRKSLIRRSWEAAIATGIEQIHVATDHNEIADHARGFGAKVLMTPETCRNGTERCAEAIGQLGEEIEIIVNLQGDAPLTPPWFVTELVAAMLDNPGIQMATPVLRANSEISARLRADRSQGKAGATTAVLDRTSRALYFSKAVLPAGADSGTDVWLHVGLYAYRREALARYSNWQKGQLEIAEGLEQLRFLENGVQVHCVEVDAKRRDFWEVNYPEDIARVEAILRAEGRE